MRQRKGFTLVEIAIVLVIIGLLTGGILIGQSMIESSRINSQVKQFQQFDIAVSNFREQFGGLPGDINTVTNGAPGNNNGIIDSGASYGFPVYWVAQEWANVWYQLSLTQMLQSKVTYTNGQNPIVAGSGVPESAIAKDIGIAAFGVPSLGKNYYEMFQAPTNWTYYINARYTPKSISAIHAAGLDHKLDDGVGSTGVMTAIVPVDLQFIVEMDLSSSCLTASGAYNLSSATASLKGCIIRLEMLASNGMN